VSVLSEIFTDFDRICQNRGLRKIKTTGHAYMAVAGIPFPTRDHAQRAAHTALDLLEAVDRFNGRRGCTLQVRIGIDTGPVVAGVIGTSRNFIYDMWGDAVTIAGLMESHGLAGRVHVTESTRGRLNGPFLLEERGIIDLKGKGPMKTWFLTGRSVAIIAESEPVSEPMSKPIDTLLRAAALA
jgi:adenylate cyclase